ncbi:GDSL-type esterase/lipase family protein [uncultured Fenollaria sp.]|uniref:GDSL-type esterase/lipase family protein n=1 Tax=uncultured Fenollaria sp. TaxID=1686315 RepID=UPI0025E30E4F|nr:GDSL-type esterase/lipase family protein [uncultured Fenollaria sp.]
MRDNFEYRRKKRKNKKTISLTIFVLILLGMIYFLYSNYYLNRNKENINVDEIFDGIKKTNIVKELIDKEIYNYNFKIKEKELLAYRKKRKEEELAKLLAKGKEVNPKDFKNVKVSKSSVNTVPISVYKEYFKEDLFIGDSITEELKYYKFLYDNNVFSKIGLNTDTLRKLIPDEDFGIEPKNIYLMMGLNDSVFVKTEEKFKERYLAMLDALEAKFPDAKIYLQAIFPVSKGLDEKEDARVNNTKINSFNEVIKTIASERGLDYLDFSYLLKENEDYFEPDGMHLKSKFHKVWLNEVKNIH